MRISGAFIIRAALLLGALNLGLAGLWNSAHALEKPGAIYLAGALLCLAAWLSLGSKDER